MFRFQSPQQKAEAVAAAFRLEQEAVRKSEEKSEWRRRHPKLEIARSGLTSLIIGVCIGYAAVATDWTWLLFIAAPVTAYGFAALGCAYFVKDEEHGGEIVPKVTLWLIGVPLGLYLLKGMSERLKDTPPWAEMIIFLQIYIVALLIRGQK